MVGGRFCFCFQLLWRFCVLPPVGGSWVLCSLLVLAVGGAWLFLWFFQLRAFLMVEGHGSLYLFTGCQYWQPSRSFMVRPMSLVKVWLWVMSHWIRICWGSPALVLFIAWYVLDGLMGYVVGWMFYDCCAHQRVTCPCSVCITRWTSDGGLPLG